jgi:hypothetical protein
VHGTEVVNAVIDNVELIGLIGLPDSLDQELELVQGKTIDLQKIWIGNPILVGIEIMEVAQ